MANINGTNLAAPIVPFTTNDTFPTHYAKYGKGGYRTVATITERDGIFTALREEGMEVYVVETSKKYALVGGISNTNWVERISNVAGSNTQVMVNDDGVLAGNSEFTYNKNTFKLNAGSTVRHVGSSIYLGDAGNYNANSDDNVGIGMRALNAINGGDQVIAIGSLALGDLVNGLNNTAIGTGALRKINNSSENSAFGAFSGYNITSGSNNLLLGFYAAHSETGSISNKLVIESAPTRNINKDYLIEGDFSQRWVRFNGALRKRVVEISGNTTYIRSGILESATSTSITDTDITDFGSSDVFSVLVIQSGNGNYQARLVNGYSSNLPSNTLSFSTNTPFRTIPISGDSYKTINKTEIYPEKYNTEYYINLSTEDHAIWLRHDTNYIGSEITFTIKSNPNNKSLYIVGSGDTTKYFPHNTYELKLNNSYSSVTLKCINNGFICVDNNVKILQPIKTSTKDLVIDLYSKIYKIDVATATTVTFNIDSSYVPILTGNSLTIELDVNMTVASAITWPVNVTWIGGSAPTFGSIAKYRLVFRTENAGTTWLGNLAYTY